MYVRLLKILGLTTPMHTSTLIFLKILHNLFFNRGAYTPGPPLKLPMGEVDNEFYKLYQLHNYQFVVWAAMFDGQYGTVMQ